MSQMTRKRGLLLLAVVLLLAAVGGGAYLFRVQRYQSAVRGITYGDVDVSAIPDGVYFGECDVDFVSARVSVTVRGGALADITLLEHKNEHGAPAERIVGDMLLQQRIDVEAVAGATNSSRVIRKAVENALLSAAAP